MKLVGRARLNFRQKRKCCRGQIFINKVSKLNIRKYHGKLVKIHYIKDTKTRSLEQYKNHPSIVVIKYKSTNKYFKFNNIYKSEMDKEILNLDSLKACQDSDVQKKNQISFRNFYRCLIF